MPRLFNPSESTPLVDCCSERPLEAVADDYRRIVGLSCDESRTLRTAVCRLWMRLRREPLLSDIHPGALSELSGVLSYWQVVLLSRIHVWAWDEVRRGVDGGAK